MTDRDAARGGPPDDPAAGFRDGVARWAVQQCEPLISGAARISAEAKLVELTQEAPRRTTVWFAGVLADQVQTLPPDDPWQNLSARFGDLTCGTAPPATDGAVSAAGAFGTIADGADLVPSTFPSPMTDVGLAALTDPLCPCAAAVLAFAGNGWSETSQALTAVHAQFADTDGAAAAAACLVATGGDALRWALWRRRVYGEPGDDWFLASAFSWTWRAERLATGDPLPPDEVADITTALEDETITVTYAELRAAANMTPDEPI
ncbi:hypothetical protein GCM10027059_50330 [Myceligenerans halotolerans]